MFFDAERNPQWNYVGEGINGGNRVLSAIGKELDDVVYLSGEVRKEILKQGTDAIIQSLENVGRKKDKHDKPWRVYRLNHTKMIANLEFGTAQDLKASLESEVISELRKELNKLKLFKFIIY